MPLPAGTLEVLHRDTETVFALLRKSVLVQSRRGALTPAALQRVQGPLRTLVGSGRPVGLLLVVEAGAPVPDEEARLTQRALIEELTASENFRMAPVILGEDLVSSMNRSAGRMVGLGSRRVQRFTDVENAIAWLVAELAGLGLTVRATELVAALDECRRLLATAG